MSIKKEVKLIVITGLSLVALNGCGLFAAGAVAGTAAVATDPRRTEIIVQDNAIPLRLQKTYTSSEFKGSNIYTTSYNGVVLLSGQVPSLALKNKASTAAKSEVGVRTVYDFLEVRPAQSVDEKAADTLITSEVKTKLLLTKGIDSNHIKVVTTNKVVYLFGVVTPTEATKAQKVVANIKGVTAVKTLFKYINSDIS